MSEIVSLKGVVDILLSPALKELDSLEHKAKNAGTGMSASFQRAQVQILKTIGPQVLGALGGVLVQIGKESHEMGKQLVDAMARFRGETGASRAEAQEFASVLGNLWRGSSGDIDTLAGTLIKLRQTFGELADVEGIAKSFSQFSKITGADTSQAITSAANAMRQLGMESKDVGQLLDLVASASQTTGVNAAELFRGIGEAQTAFDGLGISLNEGTAYLAKFQQAGGDANDFVDSYLSLAEAATQTTTDQAKAFKELGLAVDSAGRPIGGVGTAFESIIDKLAKGGAASNDFKVAILKLFGEDSGRKLIQAFSGIGDGLDELKNKLENNAGTVAESSEAMKTLGERSTALWRDAFGETIQKGAELVAWALDGIMSGLEWVVDATQDMGSLMGLTFFELEQTFGKMSGGIEQIWQATLNKIRDAWSGVYGFILDGIRLIPEELRGPLSSLEQGLEVAQREIQATKKQPEASFSKGADALLFNTTDLLTGGTLGRAGQNFTQQKVDEAQGKADADSQAKAAERERKAKEELAKADLAKAEAAKLAARAQVQAVKDSVTALEQEMALGKVSQGEAVGRYKAILENARKVKLDKKELFAIEKSLYGLQKDLSKQAEQAAKKEQEARQKAREELEKTAEATARTRIDRLKLVKGETAGLLEALELEKRERAKAGVESVELEAWYGAERTKVFAVEAEKRKEAEKNQLAAQNALLDSQKRSEQETLVAQGNPLQASLAGLDQQKVEQLRALEEQKAAIIKAGGDKLAAERAYQEAVLAAEKAHSAKRAQLLKDDADTRLKSERNLQNKILQLKADSETDPIKKAQLERQAGNERRLDDIKSTVEQAKKQGVDPSIINQYIKAEQSSILSGSKSGRETSEAANGQNPNSSNFPTFSLSTFSNDNVQKRERSSGGSSTDKKLAQQVGALTATPQTASTGAEGLLSSLRSMGLSLGGKRSDPAAMAAANKFTPHGPGVQGVGAKAPEMPAIESTLRVSISSDTGPSSSHVFSSRDNRSDSEIAYNYRLGRVT